MAIRISSQPANVLASVGDTVSFSVSAEGTGLTYRWQWCSNSGSTWENSGLTGYATDTLTVPVVEYRYGYQYRCVITDSAGNTVTSNACRLLPVEETWTYTYDANGMRTKRTNGYMPYSYIYIGSQLTQLTVGSNSTYITYDASNTPMTITYNKTVYYYVTNLQGDVTAILNASGTAVVEYTYDAWGNPLSITGSMADTLGQHNPLRYRGYVYDSETGLYYLQSRYYNPETGRFINADAFTSTGQGLLGNNVFAYCLNNPVCYVDTYGTVCKKSYDMDGDPTLDEKEIQAGSGGGTRNGNPNTINANKPISQNPLKGITYTPKVRSQMTLGDNHSFPAVVDNYGGYGRTEIIVGNDGNSYYRLRIFGTYLKQDGFFEYIWDISGLCNHRVFWRK